MPVYYLSHPYSNDPKQSFKNVIIWTRALRKKGFSVFSPILHTHTYHQYFICDAEKAGYKRGDMHDQCIDCIFSDYKGADNWKCLEPEYNEDYVAWDIALLAALAKGDGSSGNEICEICGKKRYYKENMDHNIYSCHNESCSYGLNHFFEHLSKYDSNVVMLLDRSAYIFEDIDKYYQSYLKGTHSLEEWKSYWFSDGCRIEYERCKTLKIRVLDRKRFMEDGEEVDV